LANGIVKKGKNFQPLNKVLYSYFVLLRIQNLIFFTYSKSNFQLKLVYLLEGRCYRLAVACNKRATWPLCCPSPPLGWGREWKENRQKLVGQDKGSLTEQQTKGTVTTTIQIRRIQIRRIHNTNSRTHRATLTSRCHCALPSRNCLPAAQLPPARTHLDGTWYGIPCSVWPGWVSLPGCVPSWLLVKINPVLAQPRTGGHK